MCFSNMSKHGSSQMFNVHEFVVLQAHADNEFMKSSLAGLASTTQELHEVSFSEFLNYTIAKKYRVFGSLHKSINLNQMFVTYVL